MSAERSQAIADIATQNLQTQILDTEKTNILQDNGVDVIEEEVQPEPGTSEKQKEQFEKIKDQQKQKEEEKTATDVIKDNFSRLKDIFSAFKGWGSDKLSGLEQVPMPTGIGVPLFILLLLWTILIPINGKPRIQWFFLSLIGQASLSISSITSNNPTSTTTITTPTVTVSSQSTQTIAPQPINPQQYIQSVQGVYE